MKKSYDPKEALPTEAIPSTDGVMQDQSTKELSQKDKAYVSGLLKILHSKKTAPMVEDMLKSGDPQTTIPATALQVNQLMEDSIKEKSGSKPELTTIFAGGVFLVNDLVEIGNTAGFFNVDPQKDLEPIMKDTFQQYIQKGLKDKTIDPVELQAIAEPLMSDKQRAYGMNVAKQGGIPEEANHVTAMESYGLQMQNKGMLRAQQGGPQQ